MPNSKKKKKNYNNAKKKSMILFTPSMTGKSIKIIYRSVKKYTSLRRVKNIVTFEK